MAYGREKMKRFLEKLDEKVMKSCVIQVLKRKSRRKMTDIEIQILLVLLSFA